MEASLQGLAGVLGIEGHETLTEDARRREVLEWLRRNPGWFLVVDNLDTPEALNAAERLLAHMSQGHAVITTRLANFSAHFVALELDVLSVEASVDFLKERTDVRRRKTPGDVLVSQGNLPEALASFRAGLAIAESLANSDPGNAGWRRDLSVSHLKLGDVLVSQGNLPEALASFRAGLAIAESLAKSDPGNADWRRDLIVSCVKIAEAVPGEGRVMLTRAAAIANRLRDEGRLAPVDAWMPDELARRLASLREAP